MEVIMFCTNCGKKSSINFCPSYGNPISSGQQIQQTQENDAIVHFHRKKSIVGTLLSPKLYVDGNHISNIKRNWKKTIYIPAGMHIITMKTEVTTEIRLQAERSREYYIRCDIGIGFLVGHFTLL
jgi:hypothetical protein